jgi:RNA polymerase sigma factor (sigma-70 family)
LDDRQLVQQLLAKDEKAEQYFFHAYKDRLYKLCVSLLGYQDPEAEDVLQESFIAALEKLPEFEFRSSLYSWLYRICLNHCYNRLRARKRQVVRQEEELEVLAGPLAVDKDRRKTEETKLQAMLEVVETQRSLLGKACRGLLEMRENEEKSYAEIADSLKVPIGTVMSRLARCKEALKQLVLKALKGAHRG